MLGLVVIGMSFVILSGGIDFSAGGQMALSGMLMAILIVQCRIPYAASFFYYHGSRDVSGISEWKYQYGFWD